MISAEPMQKYTAPHNTRTNSLFIRHERTITSNSDVSAFSSISRISRPHLYDPSTLSNGVVYEYFKGDFEALPDFNSLNPVKIGVYPNIYIDAFSEFSVFDTSSEHIDDSGTVQEEGGGNFAVRFTSQLKIPVDGTWSFSTTSVTYLQFICLFV